MYTFSENSIQYPDGQQNISALPEAVMEGGFIPAQPNSKGQPLPAQWLNWMFQKLWRYINRDKVTDNLGVGLFTNVNSIITLYAIDVTDPTHYIHAVGYKKLSTDVHVLTVIGSDTLTLGTPTAAGNQPVSGGTTTMIYGSSRSIGDL